MKQSRTCPICRTGIISALDDASSSNTNTNEGTTDNVHEDETNGDVENGVGRGHQTQSTNDRYYTSVDNFNTVAHQILDSNKIISIESVYGNT